MVTQSSRRSYTDVCIISQRQGGREQVERRSSFGAKSKLVDLHIYTYLAARKETKLVVVSSLAHLGMVPRYYGKSFIDLYFLALSSYDLVKSALDIIQFKILE